MVRGLVALLFAVRISLDICFYPVRWSSCESSAAIGVNNQHRPIALQPMLLDRCQAFSIVLAFDIYSMFVVFC